RQTLGRWGEEQAAAYLTSKGYEIVARNCRTPYGEIVLIAYQPNSQSECDETLDTTIVFIEVKTRATKTFGFPEESITSRKREHMLAAAQSYLQDHPDLVGCWRIDVIAVQRYSPKGQVVFKHFENVIT
ncbi:MAG: YraN family protein, partial [Anaerolineales bacterium]